MGYVRIITISLKQYKQYNNVQGGPKSDFILFDCSDRLVFTV